MELKALHSGWRRHLRHFRRLRRRQAGGQDPKVFCLSCSDSRVDVHEIFGLEGPGSVFEVKNVGGLFSEDAKAALVYALSHLKPEFIVLLHHTRCGGYRMVDAEDAEPDVRRHVVECGCLHAKARVEGYVLGMGLELPAECLERLVVEEGCRVQTESLINFLMLGYPRLYEKVRSGGLRVLPLLYDIVSGRVYRVPGRLDGSEGMVREEL